jgi:bifunctional DNA-binding transcriptional regulator/antitoxin component of YhaV-PrlF toxin-antitoxin module
MTNLEEVHSVEITITTQKDGRMTIPASVRRILKVSDNDYVKITTKDGRESEHQLVSGGELLTYGFLEGYTTVRITISKRD